MRRMSSRTALLAVLSPLAPPLACSSSGSSSAAPPSDGGGEATTTVDAAPDTSMPEASSESGAPDGATDPCGPLTTTWLRCNADRLSRAGLLRSYGYLEVSIGDPDVQLDPADHLWKAWWSTTLEMTYTSSTSTLGIKYAHSADGIAWTLQGPLTLPSTGNATDWDATKTETPTVLHLPNNPPGTQYLLLYSGANATPLMVSGSPVIDYQIGAAVSTDGTSFTRITAAQSPYGQAGLVIEAKDMFPDLPSTTGGVVADPEIVFDGTTLHLFFSSLALGAGGNVLAYGISHATSTDGLKWTPTSNPIASLGVPGAGAINGSKGPSVVKNAGGWEMYYQQDSMADLAMVPSTFNPQLGIWKSTSTDLTTWTAEPAKRELEWDGTPDEKYGWVAVGDMVLVGTQYRYYYPAFSALAPPDPSWVVPTHTGNVPSLIVLDMARRD